LSQQIVNAIMVGDKGITKDVKQAKYLVIIKKYNDTIYERLDYNFAGPIIRRATYSDSLLKILNGPYLDFASSGYIYKEDTYQNNKKEGSCYLYDDTAHAIFEYKYHLDSLISVVDLDSVSKEKKKIKEDTTGQMEAVYRSGEKNYLKIIQKNLTIPDRTQALTNGGTTRVRFVIDTDGKPIDLKIIKSVEFAFDEESLRVIALAADWMPASDKGKKVKAYREQPITVGLE